MTILRRVHTNNFTIIGNALLNDRALSAEAVGVICYLIGKPHDWTLRPGELAERFDCGADRIQRILKELIEAGYIRKVRQRNPETQQWLAAEYIVLDTRDEPLPENTLVATEDSPPLENPQMAFPALQRRDSTKTESNKSPKKKTRKAIVYAEEFERDIWGPYPMKAGTSKANAFKKWTELTEAEQQQVMIAIPVYARMEERKKFSHHLEFFISRRIFETVGIIDGVAAKPAAEMDRDSWKNVSRMYANSSNWHREWGPEPGHPRCLMPADLQQQFVTGH